MLTTGQRMRMTVRVLVALVLLFLSFAHHPAFARQITPEMASQYALPDGSIGDICFGLDGVDGAAHGAQHDSLAPVCEYCRLTSAVLLPSPPDDGYLVLHTVPALAVRPDFRTRVIDRPRILPQSRAPPVFV
jgi:hypothetical protein